MNRNILIVEDDPRVADFLVRGLKAEGFAVRLWGLKELRPSLRPQSSGPAIATAFKASFIREGDGLIHLEGAAAARCYSSETGTTRLGQCFVAAEHIFGPEDVGCTLVRLGLIGYARSARNHYEFCARGGH